MLPGMEQGALASAGWSQGLCRASVKERIIIIIIIIIL